MQPILMVIGTRPEAIKMLPVARAIRARRLPLLVVTTGQHRSMLDQVFAAFGESADFDLGLMAPGQSLTDITSRVLSAMAEVYAEHWKMMLLLQFV